MGVDVQATGGPSRLACGQLVGRQLALLKASDEPGELFAISSVRCRSEFIYQMIVKALMRCRDDSVVNAVLCGVRSVLILYSTTGDVHGYIFCDPTSDPTRQNQLFAVS